MQTNGSCQLLLLNKMDFQFHRPVLAEPHYFLTPKCTKAL